MLDLDWRVYQRRETGDTHVPSSRGYEAFRPVFGGLHVRSWRGLREARRVDQQIVTNDT